MDKGTRRFKTRKDYLKWLATGHIHGYFKKPGHQKVYVAGKRIYPRHAK